MPMPEACERGFGHADTRFPGSRAHGQFVAKITHRREAHAGNAQVFAQRGDVLHIEFVEGDDAVDLQGARKVANGVDQAL
jgi:hypothetical protein